MEAEFTNYADTLKQQGVISNYYVYEANGDQAKQISDIQDLITMGVDAIVLPTITSDGLNDVLQEAMVLLALVANFLNPGFLSGDNIYSIFKQIAFLGIACIGQTLIILTGGIDLSLRYVILLSNVLAAQMINGNESATWPTFAFIMDDDFDVALGTEAFWVPAHALGCQAYIPGIGNVLPELCEKMWHADVADQNVRSAGLHQLFRLGAVVAAAAQLNAEALPRNQLAESKRDQFVVVTENSFVHIRIRGASGGRPAPFRLFSGPAGLTNRAPASLECGWSRRCRHFFRIRSRCRTPRRNRL